MHALCEAIFGLREDSRIKGKVVPKYRSKLRIGGKIVFEDAIRYVEVLRQIFCKNENKSTHVVEKGLQQLSEAGKIVFGGPSIWAYWIVLGYTLSMIGHS